MNSLTISEINIIYVLDTPPIKDVPASVEYDIKPKRIFFERPKHKHYNLFEYLKENNIDPDTAIKIAVR